MQLGLSPAAVLYALALAAAGAAIVGVIPALKATGRQLRSGIDRSGRTARLGRIWTVQIVVQVAFIEWTGHGKMRHPRLLGVREDKQAAEVVRETP